jgi:hypothetical protein
MQVSPVGLAMVIGHGTSCSRGSRGFVAPRGFGLTGKSGLLSRSFLNFGYTGFSVYSSQMENLSVGKV